MVTDIPRLLKGGLGAQVATRRVGGYRYTPTTQGGSWCTGNNQESRLLQIYPDYSRGVLVHR